MEEEEEEDACEGERLLCKDPPLGIYHTQPSLGSRVDLINKST